MIGAPLLPALMLIATSHSLPVSPHEQANSPVYSMAIMPPSVLRNSVPWTSDVLIVCWTSLPTSTMSVLSAKERLSKVHFRTINGNRYRTIRKEKLLPFPSSPPPQTFGYDALALDNTTYVLQKNYHNPDDLPDISLPEAAACFKNILTASQYFRPEEQDMTALPASDAGAIVWMRRNRHWQILTLAQTPVELRKHVHSLMFPGAYYDLLDDTNRLYLRLSGLLKPSTILYKGKFFGAMVPICEGNFGINGVRHSVVLSVYIRTGHWRRDFFISIPRTRAGCERGYYRRFS